MKGAVHAALAAKEWRESAPAVIAGAAIYLAMPIVLTLVYAIVDPRHELLAGFAGMIWAATGWIFAAVLGAQLVCRDFGGAAGDFLLARPVSVRSVVCIKAMVGLRIVLGFILVVGILDVTVIVVAGSSSVWFQVFMAGSAAALLAFCVAFVTASITRQTVSSVMLAGLTVILLAVGPFISSRFSWISTKLFVTTSTMGGAQDTDTVALVLSLAPPIALAFIAAPLAVRRFRLVRIAIVTAALGLTVFALLMWARDALSSWVDILWLGATILLGGITLVVMLVFGLAVAVASAGSERAVRFGTRSLSWTVAIVMLSLSLAAINEVGADVPIRATVWQGARHQDGLVTGRHRFARIVRSNFWPMIEVYGADPGGDIAPIAWVSLANRFDDASDLMHWTVASQQRLFVSPIEIDGATGWKVRRFVLAFDSDDSLFLLSHRQTVQSAMPPEATTKPTPYRNRKMLAVQESRISIFRIDDKSQTASEAAPFELPEFPTPDGYAYLADAAIEDGMLLLIFDLSVRAGDLNRPRAVLARYSFEGSGPPELTDTIVLRSRDGWRSLGATDQFEAWQPGAGLLNPWNPAQLSHTRFFRGGDGRLYLTGQRLSINSVAEGVDHRLIDPVRLADGLPGFPHYSNDRGRTASMVAMVCGTLPLDERHAAASGRLGLAISRQPKPREPSLVVGQSRASPLAFLFRSDQPRLIAAGPDLLLEIHETSVIGYDVSDFTRPRRIAHVRSPRIVDAKLTDDHLYLDHGFGFSVVSLADIRAKAGLEGVVSRDR